MVLALAVPAQARSVSGIVKAVDPVAGVVYFQDGTIVHLDRSAEITVNGKQLSLQDVRTGDRVELDDSAMRQQGATSQVQQQQAQQQQPVALKGHPPVDAVGTIASVDQQAGTITLRDGRTLKVTNQTTFWQQAQPQQLRQGALVFVDDARPVAFREAGKAEMKADDGSMRMGTVASVDGQNNTITLTDGTRVRMSRAAVIRFNGQPVAITELTPGSEIVVRVHQGQSEPQPSASPATTGTKTQQDQSGRITNYPSALGVPGDGFTEFQSDEVTLVRPKPQAP
jgi:hypothetical protein